METAAAEPRQIVRSLADAPRAILRIVHGQPDEELRRRPGKDAWSAHEILAHLRACADLWGSWIHRMIAEDAPRIRYLSPRSWMRKPEYTVPEFGEALAAFSQGRRELVEVLEKLDITGWARGAVFTSTARKDVPTVLVQVTKLHHHELRHLDQLRRTVRRR